MGANRFGVETQDIPVAIRTRQLNTNYVATLSKYVTTKSKSKPITLLFSIGGTTRVILDSCHSRVIRNRQYLYPKFPPTTVVKLLQYSGFRVEHRDGFSLYK